MDRVVNGEVGGRSGLMTKEKAFAFCRCLAANAALFSDPMVVHSKDAKEPTCWFVEWTPASEEAKTAVLKRLMASRLRRATAEGQFFIWDVGGPNFVRVQSKTKQCYEVATDGVRCDCMDFVTKCGPLGLSCKHVLAWNLKLGRWSNGKLLDVTKLDLED